MDEKGFLGFPTHAVKRKQQQQNLCLAEPEHQDSFEQHRTELGLYDGITDYLNAVLRAPHTLAAPEVVEYSHAYLHTLTPTSFDRLCPQLSNRAV